MCVLLIASGVCETSGHWCEDEMCETVCGKTGNVAPTPTGWYTGCIHLIMFEFL